MNARIHPRVVIAGTHSGVGKSTVTLSLLAAFKSRGRRVQAFKVGPDFIDPGHHQAVIGRPSRNLDAWMLGEGLNLDIFRRAATDADLSVIEGMMGLFDGSSPDSNAGSTAEVARQIEAPVLLVVDGSGMARSAAAMVLGYSRFDAGLHVGGVLFNRVGGEGHYRLLKEAVESATDVPAVGYLPSDSDFTIPDRHLGLMTALETSSQELYDRLGRAAAETVDLDRVEHLAMLGPDLPGGPHSAPPTGSEPVPAASRLRVGVAYDPAFCFYYHENLELLEARGADMVWFSPLYDTVLPDVDLIYLGGGYPEVHGEALAKNVAMRDAIRKFALEEGGTVYAECGGMMYLTEAIRDFAGQLHEMAGVFPAQAVMQRSGLRLGYRDVEVMQPGVLGLPGTRIRGHEFHYSSLVSNGALHYACRLYDARGQVRGEDGLMVGNTLGLYAHLHFATQPGVVDALLQSARRRRGCAPEG